MEREDAYRQFQYEKFRAQKPAPMVSAGDLQEPPPAQQGIIQDMPRDPERLSTLDQVAGFAGSVGQGATAEFLDEALAAPMAGVAQITGAAPEDESTIETYGKMKDSIRMRQRAYETDSPVASTIGKMAGGMAGLGRVGSGIKSVAGVGALGAGYGAAEYAGALDSWSDADIQDALVQTGLSGAMGAGMQKGGQVVRDWLASRPDAIAKVLRMLREGAGASPAQLRARASDMGPEASLADVTGDLGIAFTQGARSRGGVNAIDAIERNLQKTTVAKDRIRDTMSKVTGKKEGQYYESLDALKTNRKQNAERLYGEALDTGTVLPTKRMLYIFDNNPMVKEAWQDVQKTYAKNDLPLPKLFSDVNGKSVNVDGERWPNMRAMQELKWAMDANLRTLKGSVDSAGKKEYQRALADYKDFMADVNKQNPSFRKANAQYAGDSAMLDAQETGMKHGLGSKDVEAHLEYIKGLNKSEKDAYLQGVMSSTYGKLGSSPEHMMGNINQASSENAQKVLNALVGKEGTNKIMKQFKTERRYREVDTKVRQGSQTQLRDIADEAMGKMRGNAPLEEIMDIKGVTAFKKAIRAMAPHINSKQADAIAGILTKGGGVEDALLRMEMQGMSRDVAEGIIGKLSKTGAIVAPTLGE